MDSTIFELSDFGFAGPRASSGTSKIALVER
jgi:hypothetical protein